MQHGAQDAMAGMCRESKLQRWAHRIGGADKRQVLEGVCAKAIRLILIFGCKQGIYGVRTVRRLPHPDRSDGGSTGHLTRTGIPEG